MTYVDIITPWIVGWVMGFLAGLLLIAFAGMLKNSQATRPVRKVNGNIGKFKKIKVKKGARR